MAPFSTQPLPNSMNAYSVELYNDEKSSNQCTIHLDSRMHCACAADSNPARHRSCHKARLRQFLLLAVVLLLGVGATLAISYIYDINLFDLVGLGADLHGGLLSKRQSSSFTNNKLYLIIVFVGLFLVLIAGIMLSFWCCKGSFENPLCCPCYLCACCGGIACLECIGCGLCAAGLEAA